MKKRIILVQKILKDKGLYRMKIDGIAGPGTTEALGKVPGLSESWSLKRKIVGLIQLHCQDQDIDSGDIDGYWGPQTEHAYEQLLYKMEHGRLPESWRPEDREDKNPLGWPVQYTDEFYDFYGEKGKNLVRLECPYPLRIAWNLNMTIRSFYCHQKVHDSLAGILQKVLDHYGQEEITKLRLDLWGGCYNERRIRGGNRWSMHSWGIAIDFDPSHNKLKWGRDRASFAKPEYDDWWRFWEEEGWVSLGRERNFDWMHIQAAKLK